MKRSPQVAHEHYKLENYVTHERWQSYYHQVSRVLNYNPQSVLVIGPGDGIVVNILKGYGIIVTTVDIDESTGSDILASVDNLKESGNMPEVKFDVVLCSQVLEHLPYELFSKALLSIKEYTRYTAIISLPEKSLRASIMIKPPVFRPFFFNFVIPFYWKIHKFDGEHYWELNSRNYNVKKVVNDMKKIFKVRNYYRLRTNPYHHFFDLENENFRRIFFLADGGNPHTVKWVRSLSEQGINVFLFSLKRFNSELYKGYHNIQTYHAGFSDEVDYIEKRSWEKIEYLKTLNVVRRKIKEFKPDVVHAHYATSYGILGALSGANPLYISVWGTDVFDFPKRSFFHKLLLKFNLSRASRIFSTSNVMALETAKYTNKKVQIIPFGIDLDKFQKKKSAIKVFEDDYIVIGTVKSLEEKYGIRVLLKAFSKVKVLLPEKKIKLLIVGKGSKYTEYMELSKQLGIEADTVFTGWIPIEQVPEYQNMIDIPVFPSVCEESFGVAVIEASACSRPVIVTRRGGLPEVVQEGETGLIVPHDNVDALAEAIIKLINDPELRNHLGEKGRQRVKALYDWKKNVQEMVSFYQ